MSQSAFTCVHPLVARNPVACAIERANMRKWLTSIQAEMYMLQDGEDAASLIQAACETIAVASKTLEGWADDGGLSDVFIDAIGKLDDMARAGMVWQKEHTELVADATDYACQVLCGMTAQDKQKAWAWAQAVQKQAQTY